MVCKYTYMDTYVCLYLHTCIHICLYNVHTYVYTHTHSQETFFCCEYGVKSKHSLSLKTFS